MEERESIAAIRTLDGSQVPHIHLTEAGRGFLHPSYQATPVLRGLYPERDSFSGFIEFIISLRECVQSE